MGQHRLFVWGQKPKKNSCEGRREVGCTVNEEGAALCASMEDNLMTVEGGSGCLN